MNAIYDLNIIKVNKLFSECKLSLSSRLLKTLALFASTFPVISTISSCKLFSNVVVLSSASDSTAPDYVEAVVIYRNFDVFGTSYSQLIVTIVRLRINEEALTDGSSLNALRSLKAVTVSTTLGVLGVAVSHGTTSEAEPHRLIAIVCHLDNSLGQGQGKAT